MLLTGLNIRGIIPTIALLAVLLCGIGGATCALAQNATPTDAQVKAAMIYNLAKFVEWPASPADRSGTSALTVCWLGADPIARELQALTGKTIRNRPIVVRQALRPEEVGSCQVLVIGTTQHVELQAILDMVKGGSIFTISDIQDFAKTGGMLGFVNQGGKVRFEINLDAIIDANIKVSSQVLNLAVIVKEGPL